MQVVIIHGFKREGKNQAFLVVFGQLSYIVDIIRVGRNEM